MTLTSTADPVAAAPRRDDWPSLTPVPRGPRTMVSSAAAHRLFRAAVSRLPVHVSVRWDAGRAELLGRGGPTATIHRPEEFFARLGRDGLIGFGEAYLTGAWDAPDLAGFLTVLAADVPALVPAPLQRVRRLVLPRQPRARRGTRDNSRANVAHHYDLSNELFATFLDETLSYSAALFGTPVAEVDGVLVADAPVPDPPAEPLSDAQARKVERLLDRLWVGPDTRLLEIGTGWGELAVRAGRRGARVRTITLSAEQQRLARDRVAAAGLSDRVTVDLCDYRDVRENAAYDAVVSVEMIEAVGHDFWPAYFETLDRVLAPGGRVGLQAITMPHDRMLATRHAHTWITKYVFPGGFLPSVRAIEEVARDHTGLQVVERLSFGSHYAETLRRWDEAFLASADRVGALGFDERFRRMWHFYLAYSRAGFASGYLDVQQIVMARR